MTPAELQAECDYRHAERIGILCGPLAPSPAQLAIADAEVRAYRAENETVLPSAPIRATQAEFGL